jgi:hypothetical protein
MERKTKMGLVGVVTVACGALAAVGLARLDGADSVGPIPAALGDLSRASAVEVKDAAGQVVLKGTFGAEQTDDDGAKERKAMLAATTGAGKGEAEIEITADSTPRVELEIEVEDLSAAQTFTMFVDGPQAATLTTDASGDGEVELSSGTEQ